MPPPRILVIGSSNIDLVMQVAVLPRCGQTVTGGVFTQTFGGKGANQAVAAARAGGAVTFVTRLGRDHGGRTLRQRLEDDRIETRHVLEDPHLPTGTALVMIDAQGRNYLAVAPGSNHALTAADLDAVAPAFAGAGAVVLQMEVPVEVNERALELARHAGVPVIFNYAPLCGAELAVDARMAVLVVNEDEAAGLLGVSAIGPAEAPGAALALAARGVDTAVVTLGAAGLVAARGGHTTRVAPLDVDAKDTTAAGDTFCGSLATALAEGMPLPDALTFANAAAALATTVVGAQPSIPRRDQVLARLTR